MRACALSICAALCGGAAQQDTLGRGVELRRQGRLAEAAEVFEKLRAAAPEAQCRFQLGVAAFHAGDYPAALRAFQRTLALDARLPLLYSYYGQSLLLTGDSDQAAAAFRKQLAADANDYAANFYLGEILASRRRFSDATALLRRALELRPDSAEALLALGDAEAGRFRPPPPARIGVQPGQPAPVVTIGSTRLPLPDPRRPSVLVFGSYTCPNFRRAAPELNRLAAAYGGAMPFLLVYIREAHSDADWQSTRNERENVTLPAALSIQQKEEHARMCVRRLKMSFPAATDGMDDAAEKAYAAWPSRVYVVGRDGRVRYASGLTELDFDPQALEAAIRSAR